MSSRPSELRRLLSLAPHPEGGAYRESWRAPSGPGVRGASTAIYFLLDRGELSRWHRVDADELWTHLEGGALELWTWNEGQKPERQVLGPVDPGGTRPIAVVPAGCWQAARPAEGYVLTTCTVAPAFDFKGFSLLAAHPHLAEQLRREDAALGALV
ncbi:MAG: cupin domain-containing protein [Planctomycetaceae bacterium]|nr:cupin domain-containing protein [Planctomycetaceae bacterium]